MQIKIKTTKENPLLQRTEVGFTIISGPKEKTPQRLEVKKALAAELKTGEDVVYIKHMRTKTGTAITEGVANIYKSVAQAKLVEPDYIQKRNNPTKAKEEATA